MIACAHISVQIVVVERWIVEMLQTCAAMIPIAVLSLLNVHHLVFGICRVAENVIRGCR